MKTFGLDFDGVLHAFSRGWADGTIYDGPMPGAVDAVHQLMAIGPVFIHTARPPEPVVPWLTALGFDATLDDLCERCYGEGLVWDVDQPAHTEDPCRDCKGTGLIGFWNERGRLLVTQRKLPAAVYVDDRGVRFTTWPDALATLTALGLITSPGEGTR